jgi:hypothetical protein
MIDQHLGRRSVSDFQRGVLALRKREILAERQRAKIQDTATQPPHSDTPPDEAPPVVDTASSHSTAQDANFKSREDLARAARLSSSQVVMIEKIQKQAAPELVAAVKSGVISLNAAAAVASLPEEEQIAAANAGKEELKQAAKRVRDAKKTARAAMAAHAQAPELNEAGVAPADDWSVESLRERVKQLEAENAYLRQQLAEVKPF